ncbi:perilipin-1-like [Orussus abietinus]|uniref:perilipin-1-like n=1 Tax=Orussus abietinus TaxID=222816 RepID=UPI0006251243|nr:perilipin-1-like [Orussus abietinus]
MSDPVEKAEKPQDAAGKTACIVRIAYRQLSIMTGCEDPTKPAPIVVDDVKSFSCTARILRLPVVVSVTSTVSDLYTSLKESHSAVATTLNNAEDILGGVAKAVEPATSKIGATLETPLRSIDSAICGGLDYLEEKAPDISQPAGEFYEVFVSYIRCAYRVTIQYYSVFFESMREKMGQLTANEETNGKETPKSKKD